MQSKSYEMPDWMKHKLESRLPGEISITWYANGITHMGESREELRSFLMKVKEKNEKAALKLNIQKMKIMASGPITSWHIDGSNGNSERLYFIGLQNYCRWWLHHEIKICLLLGRKAMPNLDSILKIKDITLPTKVCLVKALVFPESCMDVRVGL